jgi:RimJ/RimL family protein N-acetyltransferase
MTTAAAIHGALPIDTERLHLRLLVPQDAGALYAIQSRPDVTRWLYWEPRDEAEVRTALERQIARARDRPETGIALAVVPRAGGELIGHLTLTVTSEEHKQAEIGFMLHPDQQRNGYATEAAAALLPLAFDTFGMHRVSGRLEARNVASMRVLERIGMRREGHLVENEYVKGEWQSELIYALLEREWRERTSKREAGVDCDPA